MPYAQVNPFASGKIQRAIFTVWEKFALWCRSPDRSKCIYIIMI
jgi:hypothetical protein